MAIRDHIQECMRRLNKTVSGLFDCVCNRRARQRYGEPGLDSGKSDNGRGNALHLRDDLNGDKDEAGESEFEPTRIEQVRALAEFHLSQCHYEQCRTSGESHAEGHKMPYEQMRSHWFEYHPPAMALPGLEPQHQGKKYKIASDTWNRLDAAISEIKRRRNESELFRRKVAGKAPEQYKNRARKLPDDLW